MRRSLVVYIDKRRAFDTMSASLKGITKEATRKSERDAAIAAAPAPAAKAAADQLVLQEHHVRGLKNWTAQRRGDSLATEGAYQIPEHLIDPAVLDTWESELVAAGYVVARGAAFVVELSP
jgi:hypothetical protein